MSTEIFLAVLLSACIHAIWNIAAKRVSGNVGVLWLAQLLAALVTLPFIFILAGEAPLIPPGAGWYLVSTGFIQAAYFVLLSRAYSIGDMSVVYPIARGCGVAGAALLAMLALGERLSVIGAAGVISVCFGTFALGFGRTTDRRALLAALGVGVTLALGALNDKLAVQMLHPVVYIFWMFLLAGLVGAPLVLRKSSGEVRSALKVHKRTILIVGCGSLTGYLIILYAYQAGQVAYIAPMRELSVVIGSIWGLTARRESLGPRKAFGITAILTGLVLIKLA